MDSLSRAEGETVGSGPYFFLALIAKFIFNVRRSSVKSSVLKLLEEVGPNGLNAAEAVDIAANHSGEKLERGTVSSLLSRLKNDGTVIYDGKRYRLAKYNTGPEQSDFQRYASVITPIRTSGQ